MKNLFRRLGPSLLIAGSLYFGALGSHPAYSDSAAFLAPPAFDVTKFLGPAPAPGSATQKKDLTEVESWQKRRTAEDCAKAVRVAHVNLKTGFESPDGPLTSSEVERLNPFFSEIAENAEFFINRGKDHWRRPRPFVTESQLQTCVKRESVRATYSYPSGHATLSELFARTLTEIYPGRKEKFLARAHEIALGRVMGAVHYPSDIAAGEKLGDELFEQFEKSADFKKRIEASR